jgi:putative tryptophan/tyrosine transport system substrate-binding protein
MDRRTFIAALAVLLFTVPFGATGQQHRAKVQRVGLLATTTPVATWRDLPAFKVFLAELHKLGYVEGRDIVLEYRSAEGEFQRLPRLALDLVNLKTDVIVVPVCGAVLDAARIATRTIPIVVQSCSDDMVATGVVASLARPGGNVTGLSKIVPQVAAKRLELLKEAVPKDPGYLDFNIDLKELQDAARRVSVTLQTVEAHGREQLSAAFSTMTRDHAQAVITFSDATTYNYPHEVAELAIKSGLPMVSPFREVADAGGLMSYGPNILDMWRRSAVYVDKIFKGAKPGDLPIEQPTKFELVINLKTAKALGLTIPQPLLLRADEVIE